MNIVKLHSEIFSDLAWINSYRVVDLKGKKKIGAFFKDLNYTKWNEHPFIISLQCYTKNVCICIVSKISQVLIDSLQIKYREKVQKRNASSILSSDELKFIILMM